MPGGWTQGLCLDAAGKDCGGRFVSPGRGDWRRRSAGRYGNDGGGNGCCGGHYRGLPLVPGAVFFSCGAGNDSDRSGRVDC